jgi:hypothetical protein
MLCFLSIQTTKYTGQKKRSQYVQHSFVNANGSSGTHTDACALCVGFLSCSWMYVGYAYSVQSRELAQAVWRDRAFHPLDRFSANS